MNSAYIPCRHHCGLVDGFCSDCQTQVRPATSYRSSVVADLLSEVFGIDLRGQPPAGVEPPKPWPRDPACTPPMPKVPAPARDEIAELRQENDALKSHITRLRESRETSWRRMKRDFNTYAQHTAPCPGTPCSCALTLTRAMRGYPL